VLLDRCRVGAGARSDEQERGGGGEGSQLHDGIIDSARPGIGRITIEAAKPWRRLEKRDDR
jgi:hypothetical protein